MSPRTIIVATFFLATGVAFFLFWKGGAHNAAPARFSQNEQRPSPTPVAITENRAAGISLATDDSLFYFEQGFGRAFSYNLREHRTALVSDVRIPGFVNGLWSSDHSYASIESRGEQLGVRYFILRITTGEQAVVASASSLPVFSPDGRRIAFIAGNSPDRGRVVIVQNIDGSSRSVALTTRATRPRVLWSPNGDLWAILEDSLGNGSLVKVRGNSSSAAVLSGLQDLEVLWSPDGDAVFYSFSKEGERRAAVLNIQTQQKTLFAMSARASACTWRNGGVVVCGVPTQGWRPGIGGAATRDDLWEISRTGMDATRIFLSQNFPVPLGVSELRSIPSGRGLVFLNPFDQLAYLFEF